MCIKVFLTAVALIIMLLQPLTSFINRFLMKKMHNAYPAAIVLIGSDFDFHDKLQAAALDGIAVRPGDRGFLPAFNFD